jgi:outer membrane protein assembly factor BamB
MIGHSPSLPPIGTRENAVAARAWRLTAGIAAAFTLLVGIGMIAAHVRLKASDPWRSPVLLDLKAQLLAEPRNEELKEQIRELDLQLRDRYFHLLSLKATGVYLVFAGTLVLAFASSRVRQLQRQLPMPKPDPEAAARLIRLARLSRNAVIASSLVALAAFSVLAFSGGRSPLADEQIMSALRASDEEPSATLSSLSADVLKAQWHRFRGYGGAGVAGAGFSMEKVPVALWRVPSPAPGFSSPIIWENQLFLTGGDQTTREVFALSVDTGALQWRQTVAVPAPPASEEAPEIPEMTGYAASTAATDGERVYAIFATGELAAFTLEGLPVWSKHLGVLDNPYGHASSLLTWGHLLIIQLDQGYEDSRTSKLIAVDGRTGEMEWQTGRPVGASWATPIVVEVKGEPQIVTLGAPWVIAYSPADGAEQWRARLLEGEITPSPVSGNDRIFIVDPGMYELVAIRPDGTGDVTDTHLLWRVDGDMPDITSPVSDGEHVFTVTTGGEVSCFDAASGQETWTESLETDGEIQASPSLAGGVVLVITTGGDVIGLEAGGAFRELWRTQLDDQFYASPAFVNQRMILRGNKSVWCLSSAETEVAQP